MIVLRCSSGRNGIPPLVESTEGLACPCLLLSPKSLEGRTGLELEFSFHLARRAFADGRNISGKVQNEALMFLSREMNFASAIRRMGADDVKDFVLVCEKSLPLPKVKEALGLTQARKFPLPKMGKKKGAYFEGELAVEEMALARVRN